MSNRELRTVPIAAKLSAAPSVRARSRYRAKLVSTDRVKRTHEVCK